MQRRVAVRPDRLVAEAVEPGVGFCAAVDMDPQGLAGGEAEVIVPVGRRDVIPESLGVTRRAGDRVAAGVKAERRGRDGVRALAVLEVPDLAGKGDVVGVGRPDDPGLLRRGGVHRVEVVRKVDAAGAGRVVLDLAEPVGRAGGHRSRLPAGLIVEDRPQPVRRVLQGHADVVAGVHEQVAPAWRERRGGGIHRVRRGGGPAVLGDERVVDVLGAADPCQAGRVLDRAGDRVLGEAEDVHRGAPPGRVAGAGTDRDLPGRPGHPPRRVELQFHERGAGVVGRGSRVQDVAVAVRGAGGHLLRVGLRGAQRHAQPDRPVQLERVGLAWRVRVGWRGVVRQDQRVGHVVPGPRGIGVEDRGRLVVPDILRPEGLLGVGHFGAHAVLAVDRRVLACARSAAGVQSLCWGRGHQARACDQQDSGNRHQP